MRKQEYNSLLVAIPLVLATLLWSCASSEPEQEHVQKNSTTSQIEPSKNCMITIITLDDSLGKLRNHACETQSLSETIKQYIAGIEALNFDNCPEDFSAAFKRHTSAWSAVLVITDKYPALRGEMHDLFNELEAGEDAEQFKLLVKAIWDTWAEIEKAMIDESCVACERIQLFDRCKKLVSEKIWKGLNDETKVAPLLYYTDDATYIAFLNDNTLASDDYEEVECNDGYALKKLHERLDQQPFHMENKMSFGDSASMFYYRPMMLCSDAETMHKFVPAFSKTEDWLQLVMHEYFHSFQFSHENNIQYLANTIQIAADTLDKIYSGTPWFQHELAMENHLLLSAIATSSEDSVRIYIDEFVSVREARRNNYQEITELNFGEIENFWETIEGTARYAEYYMAGNFGTIAVPEGEGCDNLFGSFQKYRSIDNFEDIDEFKERTKIMTAYYYVTGFNLCRVMDKLNIKFKEGLFNNPEKGLYKILLENYQR